MNMSDYGVVDPHPILSWYEADDVEELRIRKGGKTVAVLDGYLMEDEVMEALRDEEHYGTFDVHGVDAEGQVLDNAATVTVTKQSDTTDPFSASKHFSAPAPSKDVEVTGLHFVQTQVEQTREERSRAAREARNAEREARRIERAALEREMKDKEALAEERLRLEREKYELERDTVEARLRDKQESTQRALEQMRTMFEQQNDTRREEMATRESFLVASTQAQLSQSKNEVEAARNRLEYVERRAMEDARESRQREEDLRRMLEGRVESMKELHEDRMTRMQQRHDDLMQRAEQRYEDMVRRLEDKIAAQASEIENYRSKANDMQLEFMRLQLEKPALSEADQEMRRIQEKARIAKENGLDPRLVVREELGMEEEEDSAPNPAMSMLTNVITNAIGGGLQNGQNASMSDGNEPSVVGADSRLGMQTTEL